MNRQEDLFSSFPPPTASEWLAAAGSEFVHDFEPGIFAPALPDSRSTETLDNTVLVERPVPFPRERAVRVDLDELPPRTWLETAGITQVGVAGSSVSLHDFLTSDAFGLHFVATAEEARNTLHLASRTTNGSLSMSPQLVAPMQDELFRLLPDCSPSFRALGIDLTKEPAAATTVGRVTSACLWAKRILDSSLQGETPVKVAARHLAFVFPCSDSLWIEVAFLRATRILLGEVLSSYSLGRTTASPLITLSPTPELADELPEQRLIRYSAAACAAFLGEADMIAAPGMHVLTGGSLIDSQRLLASTQLALIHEARLGELRDPVAGSTYVESLTTRIARAAWIEFQRAAAEVLPNTQSVPPRH